MCWKRQVPRGAPQLSPKHPWRRQGDNPWAKMQILWREYWADTVLVSATTTGTCCWSFAMSSSLSSLTTTTRKKTTWIHPRSKVTSEMQSSSPCTKTKEKSQMAPTIGGHNALHRRKNPCSYAPKQIGTHNCWGPFKIN